MFLLWFYTSTYYFIGNKLCFEANFIILIIIFVVTVSATKINLISELFLHLNNDSACCLSGLQTATVVLLLVPIA